MSHDPPLQRSVAGWSLAVSIGYIRGRSKLWLWYYYLAVLTISRTYNSIRSACTRVLDWIIAI